MLETGTATSAPIMYHTTKQKQCINIPSYTSLTCKLKPKDNGNHPIGLYRSGVKHQPKSINNYKSTKLQMDT